MQPIFANKETEAETSCDRRGYGGNFSGRSTSGRNHLGNCRRSHRLSFITGSTSLYPELMIKQIVYTFFVADVVLSLLQPELLHLWLPGLNLANEL